VTIAANSTLLSVFDEKSDTWKLVPGTYSIELGAASDDLKLQTTVNIP